MHVKEQRDSSSKKLLISCILLLVFTPYKLSLGRETCYEERLVRPLTLQLLMTWYKQRARNTF